MALTLAESAKLSQDMLQRGVIETILEESPILQELPFMEVVGNAYKYNQENVLASASFFAVDGTWSEGTTTFTEKTASLKILGGDADVDNFLQLTRSNINDQRATQTHFKAKAISRKFEQTFITGDSAVDVNSFDGVRKLCAASQTIAPGANGGALTLSLLDQLIDLVRPGKPDMLLMSRRTRRKLKSLLQSSNHYVERGETSFGRMVMLYDGIPVLVSDFQPDDETKGTGTALSSLWAIKLSEEEGLVGLQNGGIDVIDIGQLETKDATRVRIRWYVSLALKRDVSLARLEGLTG